MGEGEGQEEIAAALKRDKQIRKREKQRSNFARRKIFVVCSTTRVLPFDFSPGSNIFESFPA
jgi:hypothetical protein